PVYWFSISAQLKLVIDRTFAFMDENYNSRIAGKKAVTIMTCGTENVDECGHIITMFRMIFDLQKLEYAGNIIATGCPTDAVSVKSVFIEKAKELAASLF
ncbi:MAG: NAD(P)H-dependent oxidoreductase, partial [Syntrophorhabdaceae bacterium]|nr:NAD(P)H-dependent oxidoreductase [Syntrophorhabdaceae bacterium]